MFTMLLPDLVEIILHRVDDEDLYSWLHAGGREPSNSFWKKRMNQWLCNTEDSDRIPKPSRVSYLNIATIWRDFELPLHGCSIEVYEIIGRRPCHCPYHMFVQKEFEDENKFIAKQVLCAPNFIQKNWILRKLRS